MEFLPARGVAVNALPTLSLTRITIDFLPSTPTSLIPDSAHIFKAKRQKTTSLFLNSGNSYFFLSKTVFETEKEKNIASNDRIFYSKRT